MNFHPYSELFPLIDGVAREELKNDLKLNGQRQDILLYDKKILDGRNRYVLLLELGIEPKYTEYTGNNPLAEVLSLNLIRRHLDESQRSILSTKIDALQSGESIDHSISKVNRYDKAELFNVSAKSVQRATTVVKHGNKKLIEAVEQGHVPVSIAAKMTKQTDAEITHILEEVGGGAAPHKSLNKIVIEKAQQVYIKTNEVDIKPEIVIGDAVDYLSNMADNSIDLLLTDPPYSTDVKDINKFLMSWLPIALDKLKPTGRGYICIGAYPNEVRSYLNYLYTQDKFIIDNPLIWTYKNTLGITPKMKYNLNYQMILHIYTEDSLPLDTSITNEMFSVMEINAPDGRLGNRFHTWQKPDELAERLIRHSTKENMTVVDPFSCTGTFLLAASKINRKAFGCEINAENANIAKKRGCIIK